MIIRFTTKTRETKENRIFLKVFEINGSYREFTEIYGSYIRKESSEIYGRYTVDTSLCKHRLKSRGL